MKKLLITGLTAMLLYLYGYSNSVKAEPPQQEIFQETDSTRIMDNPLSDKYYQLKENGRLESIEKNIEIFLGKGEKSRREEIEKGIIENIRYDLKYSKVLGNVIGFLGLKNSEIKVNINNKLGEFKIDSVDPDYIISKKNGKRVELKEDLNSNKNDYLCTDEGYKWVRSHKHDGILKELREEQGSDCPIICHAKDIDVIARLSLLYKDFKSFLGNANYVEIHLCVDRQQRNVPIAIEQLDENWYSLKSYTVHKKEDKGQLRVKKVFVLLYSPKDSNIGIPYMTEIHCQKSKTDNKGNMLLDNNNNKIVENTKLSANLDM